MTRILVSIIAIVFTQSISAQVINNNIDGRVRLLADSASLISSTQNSTVESECINKTLTRKCLVYHNDQWFVFRVPAEGRYFLNIGEQDCRDKRGLQLILIEGNPCEITTYRIKKCISKMPQDDSFVMLDSLKPDTDYLVNVDGFLGDLCRFEIQLSRTPYGLPYVSHSMDTLNVTLHVSGRIVSLQWQIEDSLARGVRNFLVYKSTDNDLKSSRVGIVPVGKNTYGEYRLDYSLQDTLTRYGRITYSVYGIRNDGVPELLGKEQLHFREGIPIQPLQNILAIPLNFKNKSEVEIYIYDSSTDRLLSHFYHTAARKQTVLNVNVSRFIEQGTHRFLIRLVNGRRRTVTQYAFVLDETGKIVSDDK